MLWVILAAAAMVAVFYRPLGVVKSTGLATKGIRSEFFNRFEATPSYYAQWSTRIASNSDRETYKWLGSVPQMREWGTGRLAMGLRTESYSIENMKYEATIEVDRDEISDDQTGQIQVRIGELAQRAATHKDYLISQLLINGATSGYNSYDGVSFFNDAHVSGASGNQDNLLGPSSSTPTAPSTADFATALNAAIAAMIGFKDDQGQPFPIMLDQLVCVVPPTMRKSAIEATSAAIISNTSNAALQSIAGVVALPWLTTATTWYLLHIGGIVKPFVFQDREPIEFTSLDAPDSETGFLREKYLYGCRARYRMTYGYWQYAVANVFASP